MILVVIKKFKCNIFYLKGGPQDNLNAIQRAIDSMEEKGLQENPRYSQLLALRARQGTIEPPRSVQVCLHSWAYVISIQPSGSV